jgi:selenium-binding protein 1
MTDNVISMDDKYLYFSLYLHGCVRQYDITDRRHPRLVGHAYVGGSYHKNTQVRLTDDPVDVDVSTYPVLHLV